MDKKGAVVLNQHAELVQEPLSPLVVSRLLKAHGRCSFLEGFLSKLKFVLNTFVFQVSFMLAALQEGILLLRGKF